MFPEAAHKALQDCLLHVVHNDDCKNDHSNGEARKDRIHHEEEKAEVSCQKG